MKYRRRSLAVAAVIFVVFLSSVLGKLYAGDDDLAPLTVVAAQTAKQQCARTCRARYRDCQHLNQFPLFVCQSVYQDCIQYACTGAGPG
jgi:hypothetical protein